MFTVILLWAVGISLRIVKCDCFTAVMNRGAVVFSRSHHQSRTCNENSDAWDVSKIPLHTFKHTEPLLAKVTSVEKLTGPNAPGGETCKIVLNHSGRLKFWEGQSCGIIPPGV